MTKARDLASSGVTLTSTTTTADAALARAGGTMTGDLAMGTNLVDGVDVSARDAVLTSTTTLASAALPKSGGAMTGAITTNSTFDGVDIATRDAVLSSTTTTATNALNNANNALPKEGGAMTGPITTNSTFDGVDVGSRDSVLTSTTTTADAALPRTGGAMTGAITTNSTFDGVDIATRDAVLTATTTTANAALPKSGGTLTGVLTGVGITTNGPRNLIQRANDDSSIAFANNGSGTPSSHVWAAGLDYSNSNAFSIAYGSGGIPSLDDAKMVIDVSGRLGIGVTPSAYGSSVKVVQLANNAVYGIGQNAYLAANNYFDGSNNRYIATDEASRLYQAAGAFVFESAASGSAGAAISFSEKMRVAANGNVGINIAAPLDLLHLNDPNDDCVLNLDTATANKNSMIKFSDPDAQGRGFIQYAHFDDSLRLHVAGSERLRIDSSGSVFVGKTAASNTAVGIQLAGTQGQINSVTTDAGGAQQNIFLNRQDSDGNHILFRKGNGTVGSIGTASGYMVIGSPVGTDAHLLIGNGRVHPATSIGNAKNNAIDLGGAGNAFKDLYLSGGVVFGPASASAVSSQTLDSYEQGTWTPTLPNGGTVGTVHSAIYTKIGNRVTVNLYFNFTATNNTSGFYIGGLPYGVSSNHYGGGNIGYLPGVDTGPWSAPLQNSSHIYFYNSNTTNNLITNNVMGGVQRSIILEVFYQTG